MTGRRWIWGVLPLVLLAGLVVVVTQTGLLDRLRGLETIRTLMPSPPAVSEPQLASPKAGKIAGDSTTMEAKTTCNRNDIHRPRSKRSWSLVIERLGSTAGLRH